MTEVRDSGVRRQRGGGTSHSIDGKDSRRQGRTSVSTSTTEATEITEKGPTVLFWLGALGVLGGERQD